MSACRDSFVSPVDEVKFKYSSTSFNTFSVGGAVTICVCCKCLPHLATQVLGGRMNNA